MALGIGLAGLGIDQATKSAVLQQLQPGVPVEVLGSLLRLRLVFNPGAAFGMGTSLTFALSIFAIVALLGCLIFGLPRVRRVSHGAILGLLMAGIAGNLYDRLLRPPGVMLGHVVDFVQLPYFAIFNVADVCITTAAALIIIVTYRRSPEEDPQ